ncbi:MAG: hypothetical protein JWM61_2333 [Micrococcaceae bacterium]|nr:hypothetical protein [Micrococcaceae bacterium]
MSPVLLITILPLGLFLAWASISMIRQKWMYLLVGDSFLPGKPSLAMLPIGILMACAPFNDLIYGLPQAVTGPISLFLMACLVSGFVGCFYVPRFLQPRWMKDSDDEIKRGGGLYAAKYRSRVLRPGPTGEPLGPTEQRKAP